ITQELVVLVFVSVLAGLMGLILGYPFLALFLVLLVYQFKTHRNLFTLYSWLKERKKEDLPEITGIWGELFNEIYQIDKETRQNRARLTNMLVRFQEAAQALPDGMVILNKKNYIEWANLAAQNLLGLNNEEDVGQPVLNLIRQPEFRRYLSQTDQSVPITITSGANGDYELSLLLIPYGSSQKLLICRDITHISKLEDMRQEFIANVSHELRSPLTVLSGYLEMLQEEAVNGELSEKALLNMSHQTVRMQNLVKDLLMLSKLETEPHLVSNENVDMQAVIENVVKDYTYDKSATEHSITLDVQADLKLKGEAREIYSLVSNLVSNALRYTPEGGDIAISWKLEHQQGVLSVKDNGPGIAQHHIPRLTERFYRVEKDRSRESGGTGLGLSIVKHILDRYHGQLQVVSRLGEGSNFICRFPVNYTR
ncbi:MAG: phosphate regulon sensor histidine kinase PhoR, partial [Gammaproteobacteria bacterium]|nr:phosphate regulon sensor histidine kinase PhoR [Gammaproteobacteria bacterium]